MMLAFCAAYFIGLVCLYAGLSYIFGLKIALVLFGAIHVSCFLLLLVLCPARPNRNANSSREKWAFDLTSLW
jgi:hypothetical protein